MSAQPEALHLAGLLDAPMIDANNVADRAAAELRRLHALNAQMLEALEEAAGYTRHPDYDWSVEFCRQVSAAIAAAKEQA